MIIESCPHCNDQNLHVLPGKGPHKGQLRCSQGHFVKWLSLRDIESYGGFTIQQMSVFGGGES